MEVTSENGRILHLVGFDGDVPRYQGDYNQNAAISTNTHRVRNAAPFNVTGSGFVLGLWEAAGIPRLTHQEFNFPGKITVADGTSTVSDHATHVAGTLAALGIRPDALGMAPAAFIAAYDSISDKSEMLAAGAAFPFEPGKLLVSNHSYGLIRGWDGSTFFGQFINDGNPTNDFDFRNGRYDSSTATVDSLTYLLPYYLPFMSSGNDRNDGPPANGAVWSHFPNGQTRNFEPQSHPPGDGRYKFGFDLVDPDKVAKNVITVGATEDAVMDGQRSPASALLTSFSSTGPTDDGRIKPDIVANGAGLLSASSSSDTAYVSQSGTSMSAPNASGSALLLQEYYSRRFPGQLMRAATLKALIIHTADDIGTPGPDYRYGWGLMNTQAAASLIQRHADNSQPFMIEGLVSSPLEVRHHAFTWNSREPIRVTLCWTDPPAPASTSHDDRSPKLVNDLDLLLTGPAGSFHQPYVMPYVGDWSREKLLAPATTGVNRVDNVEQVLVISPSIPGTYTVSVRAPLVIDRGSQPYSLIISGAGGPDTLTLTPFSPFDTNASAGSSFAGTQTSYQISNDTSTASSWTASTDAPWVAVSASSGSLAPGEQTSLTLTLAPSAEILPAGIHTAKLLVARPDGPTHERLIRLEIIGTPLLSLESPEFTTIPLNDHTIDFGAATPNSLSRRYLWIKNSGTAPLELTPDGLITGPHASFFHASSPSQLVIGPGESSTILLSYRSVSTGLHSAQFALRRASQPDSPIALVDLAGTSADLLPSAEIQLVRHINEAANSGAFSTIAPLSMGSYILYQGSSFTHGAELWRSDGTASGTFLVADINPGTSSSSPSNFTRLGSLAFFTASTTANGTELWVSDGTAAGTRLLRDINPGVFSSFPGSLHLVGSTLYFAANDGTNGSELWKSDGTLAGTSLVANINPLAGSGSSPANLASIGSILYFAAANDVSGTELWQHDIGTGITSIVADINPGSSSSSPASLTPVGSSLFFTASNGTNGMELWRLDTVSGITSLVADINPGSLSSSPFHLVAFNSQIFFRASNPTLGTELWRSDGTPAGTQVLIDINPGSASGFPIDSTTPVVFQNRLYFAAFTPAEGTELWSTDGTPSGTSLILDALPDSASSTPTNLTIHGERLFFAAFDSKGRELWLFDGSPTGTRIVRDIHPGSLSSSPARLVSTDSQLFFIATDTVHGTELWRSDGSRNGTRLVADTFTGFATSAMISPRAIDGNLYFSSTDNVNGFEPWTATPSLPSARLLRDINVGSPSSSPSEFTAFPGGFLFAASTMFTGSEIYRYSTGNNSVSLVRDIHIGNVNSSPASFVRVGDRVFFTATDPTNGTELWVTDGTTAGTTLVRDIAPGGGASAFSTNSPMNGVALGGNLVFTANDGSSGIELWASDGTASGTIRLADINGGTASSSPSFTSACVIGSVLYFAATSFSLGTELWRTDGTPAGTSLVLDVASGLTSSNPSAFAQLNGSLLFSAITSTHGRELWISNGTAASTSLLRDINPGSTGSSPASLATFNGRVFFSADNGSSGAELWSTDGTTSGTSLLVDLAPGASPSSPSNFTAAGRTLFFRATTPDHGTELWRTFGTSASTALVGDLVPGTVSSSPSNFTAVNRSLYFTASIPGSAAQLLRAEAASPPAISVAQPSGPSLVSGAASLNFGTANVSSPVFQQLVLTNLGDQPLTLSTPLISGPDADQFQVSSFSQNIIPGGRSLTLSIAFSALGSGARTAFLNLPTDDPLIPSFQISLSGTAANPPTLTLNPFGGSTISSGGSYSFGSRALGVPHSVSFTITSTSSDSILSLQIPQISGPDSDAFSLDSSSTALRLPAPASTTFTLRFHPQSPGIKTATLTLPNNSSTTSPFTLQISGNGSITSGASQTLAVAPLPSVVRASAGPITFAASASSGLPVTAEIVAGSHLGSLSGLTFTPAGPSGIITIRFSQSGAPGINPAEPIHLSFRIASGSFVKIASGTNANHVAAIMEDGSLWTWGFNISGQIGNGDVSTLPVRIPVQVAPDQRWKDVSVGAAFTVAIRQDGTLWSWGSSISLGIGATFNMPSPVQVGTFDDFESVSAGGNHVLALRQDGSLWGWGLNSSGQLGIGDTTTRSLITQIGFPSGWTAVSCGTNHSLALRSDGSLWATGSNGTNQLGLGDSTQRNAFTQIGSATDWRAISAGGSSSYAIKTNGTLWSWGGNINSQLGLGSASLSPVTFPTQVGSASDWLVVSAGSAHATGVLSDGSLLAWGSALEGAPGHGSSLVRSTPTAISTERDWTTVAAAANHTVALKRDGSLWAAGSNGSGQLASPNANPVLLASGGVRSASNGGPNLHFIKFDGSLWGLGNNFSAFGDGTSISRPQPIQIGSFLDWSGVSSGSNHILALRQNGTLWASGSNTSGQLGLGDTNPRPALTQVGSSTSWRQISAGSSFSAALQSDGSLWTWGLNSNGQLALGSTTTATVPTRVGSASDWTQVASGNIHVIALKSNGTAWAAGFNATGQLGNGTTTTATTLVQIGSASDWIQIAGGGGHTLLLKNDGSVWACGFNAFGQLGDGSTTSRSSPVRMTLPTGVVATAIAAGPNHSLVLTSAGTVYATGQISGGQASASLLSNTQTSPVQLPLHLPVSRIFGGRSALSIFEFVSGDLTASGTNIDLQLTNNVRSESQFHPAFPPVGSQTISSPPLAFTTFNQPIPLATTASSGLPVTYSVSGPAILSGNSITVTGPGPVYLSAWQSGMPGVWQNAAPFAVPVLTPPTATLSAATQIGNTSVTLSGQIFPGSNPATVIFEYDHDISDATFDFQTPATSSLPLDGPGPVPVSAQLTDLQPSTTYHFRLVISTATGSITTPAQTFTTTTPLLSVLDGPLGSPSILHASTPGLTFASVGLGQSGPARTFTLVNSGSGPLRVSAITAPLGWSLSLPSLPAQIPAGSSATFTATFTPPILGSVSGSIRVSSDDPALPLFDIRVSGFGLSAQLISFDPIPQQACGTPLLLSASASSGLPVSYSIVQGAAFVVFSGSTLNFTGTGLVIIQASQSGDSTFAAATPVTRSFNVVRGAQTLVFASPPPTSASHRSSVSLAAASDRGLTPVTYQLLSGPGILSGSTLSFSAPGTVSVQLSQAGDPCFLPIQRLVSITATNSAPIASALSTSGSEDSPITGQLAASDPDSDPVFFSKVTDPANGSISITPTGTFTYTPNPNFHGTDSFTFKANDSRLDSPPASVALSVTPINDTPLAFTQTLTTPDSISRTITLAGTDIENSPLSFRIVSPPSRGSLSGTPPTISYTSDPGYAGPDTFSFVTNDGLLDSAPATITLNITPVAPVITAPPTSLTLNPTSPASFSATHTGSRPISYQWLKNQQPIPNAVSSTLVFSSITEEDEAQYAVVISNAVGSVISPPASLTVNDPVRFVSHPSNMSVGETEPASFSVSVSGTGPFSFQWRQSGVPLSLPSATTATLHLTSTSLADQGTYDVVVTNTVGSFTSLPATLQVVGSTPLIVTPPAPALVQTGAPLHLSVRALGRPPLSYQWLKNGRPISGSTSSTHSIWAATLSDAATYSVRVTSTASVVASTSVAVVTNQPDTLVLEVGAKASLKAITAGSGLMYAWKKDNAALLADPRFRISPDGRTLTITSLASSDAGRYHCAVTAHGSELASAETDLGVFSEPPSLVSPQNLPDGIVGGPYQHQILLAGSPSARPSSFSAKGLPPGVTIHRRSGLISGTPTKAGAFTVTVIASNRRGAPSFIETIEITPLPSHLPGSYSGLVARSPALNADLGGRVDLTVLPSAAASGRLTLGSSSIPFKGLLQVDLTHAAVPRLLLQIPRPGRPTPQPLTLHLDLPPGLPRAVSGRLTAGSNEATIDVWPLPWHTRTNPALSRAGYHTLALEPDSQPGNLSLPQGSGFATFTLATSGSLRLVGKLPDGTPITHSTLLGNDGQIGVFFLLLPRPTPPGSLLGRIDQSLGSSPSDSSDNSLSGHLSWTRPSRPGPLYPSGITALPLQVVGGAYLPPPLLLGSPTPSSEAADLLFAEAGLDDSATDPSVFVAIGASNFLLPQVTPAAVSLSASNSKGLFSGSFTLLDPHWSLPPPAVWTRKVPFEGIIIRIGSSFSGRGHFLLPQIPITNPRASPPPIYSGQTLFQPR